MLGASMEKWPNNVPYTQKGNKQNVIWATWAME
jgi:hypothetical protein